MSALIDAARHHPRRALAVACAVLGAGAIVIGWIGASDSVYTAQQVPYLISGGLGGLFLMALGAVTWVSEDLRREADEVHALARAAERLVTEDEQAGVDGVV